MKKTLAVLAGLALLIVGGISGFLLGKHVGKPAETIRYDATDCVTIFAEIQEIHDNTLLVDGLDMNDVNGQGDFSVTVTPDVPLTWNNTAIKFDDLQIGDIVSITYTGEVLEVYPAIITAVQISRLKSVSELS